MAAVVLNGFNRALGGEAGSHGGHQHHDMLSTDHGPDIVPENDLGIGVVLRLQNIDGLVGVDGAEAGLGQLLGNAGTQHGRAVQAEDGIHRRIIEEMGNQLISGVLRLAEPGLLEGNINIIIDMGVIGNEVSLGKAQRHIAPLYGQFDKLDHRTFLQLLRSKKKAFFTPAEAFSPDT